MINADVMKALGPRGVIINVARGTVVDEQAMIAALKSGTILGAGLDVFEKEPNVPDELKSMQNVVLLPHIGSASDGNAQRNGSAGGRQSQGPWFAGKPPLDAGPGDARKGQPDEISYLIFVAALTALAVVGLASRARAGRRDIEEA